MSDSEYVAVGTPAKKKPVKSDDAVIEAKEVFQRASDAENENRERALECLRFARLGEQWPDKIRREREEQGRPCLTINVLPSFIRQVTNETRQNKPAIQVNPVDSYADPNTAHVYSGIIRNIEQISNAGVAYDTASDFAVSGGFGYFRIGLEYSHDDSFDKDLMIQSVQNPFSIYGDPTSTKEDSSDWNSAFVTELITKVEFARKYKGAAQVDWDTLGYSSQDRIWVQEDSVMLAEYWEREEVRKTIYKLSTGAIVDDATWEENKEFFEASMITVVADRPGLGYKVTCKLMSGAEILETNPWAGKYIPLIPVYGETVNIEGKRYLRSLIADAMDPQRMHNFWRTQATESVSLASRTPFIGPEEAFQGKDANKWAQANNAAYSYISYKGQQAPARQPYAGSPVGELNEALAAADDMKRTMGLFDASLGQRSNETSGKAINARKVEGETATFHFPDNLARSITHGARVIVDLIPKVYTGARMIRILGVDGTPQSVSLRPAEAPQMGMPPQQQQNEPAKLPNGMPDLTGVFSLDVGKYDVTVSVGPSYQTQRQEAAEQMTAFVQAYPDAAPIIGDLLVKNLDWPGSEEIAARLKAMLPPQLQEQNGALPDPRMQALQAQLQQVTQALQECHAQLQEAQTGQAEKVMQAKSDMERAAVDSQKNAIEYYKAETDRMVAETERVNVQSQADLTGAQTTEHSNSGEALAGLMQAAQAMAATVAALQGQVQHGAMVAMSPKVKRSTATMPDGRVIQMETTEDAPMMPGQMVP